MGTFDLGLEDLGTPMGSKGSVEWNLDPLELL